MTLRPPIVLFALLLAFVGTAPALVAQRPADPSVARANLARGADPDVRAAELLG